MSSLKMLASEMSDYLAPAAGAPGDGFAWSEQRRALHVCQDFGIATLRAVAHRRLMSRLPMLSRVPLLLRVTRLPQPLRRSHRAILAGVDVVLTASSAVADAIRALGIPASRIVLLLDAADDFGMFAAALRPRVDANIHHLIHVGDLEPEAGVADFLGCAQGWAVRNPDKIVDLWWAGDGCLRGVLQAQPTPPNLEQHFVGELPRPELAALFLKCDLLVVPALSDPINHGILEALTAGLPVLGSSRVSAVRELITPGETGWIFDPLQPGGMAVALDIALATIPASLEEMRMRAAARFGSAPGSDLDERIQKALQLAMFRHRRRPVPVPLPR